MAYLMSRFFEGGTEGQYNAVLDVAHPGDGLPPGQTYHAAGPADGGWLVVTHWDPKEACDAFTSGALALTLQERDDTFAGPIQERACEITNLITG